MAMGPFPSGRKPLTGAASICLSVNVRAPFFGLPARKPSSQGLQNARAEIDCDAINA